MFLANRDVAKAHFQSSCVVQSFEKESLDSGTFPEPEASDDHGRQEEEAKVVAILQHFFRRTINVADQGEAKHEVNPAEDRALSRGGHRKKE